MGIVCQKQSRRELPVFYWTGGIVISHNAGNYPRADIYRANLGLGQMFGSYVICDVIVPRFYTC